MVSTQEISFSNIPVPRGMKIREVKCIDLGNGLVEATEIKRSSITSNTLSRRSIQVRSEFSRESLFQVVWRDQYGYNVFPK